MEIQGELFQLMIGMTLPIYGNQQINKFSHRYISLIRNIEIREII